MPQKLRQPALSSKSSPSVPDTSYDSDSSLDSEDEELNSRVSPYWPRYRSSLSKRGFRLDTVRDVRAFYANIGRAPPRSTHGADDDALCRDPGLPDRLFRGTRIHDGKKIIVKAVCLRSHEYAIIRYLSSPPLRDNRLNHTIPVLDLVPVPDDDIGFIVMEEWTRQLMHTTPCSLRSFLRTLRQCIEGIAFLHANYIAHLDISIHNLLTDDNGRYAYIDFECSRRFPPPPPSSYMYASTASGHHHSQSSGRDVYSRAPSQTNSIPNMSRASSSSSNSSMSTSSSRSNSGPPRIRGYRGTEVPPDVERGADSCPFAIDVWALGILILRACQMTGYEVPELTALTVPMLAEVSDARPPARAVLAAFDKMVSRLGDTRLGSKDGGCACG
ncbi:hypothetical protein BD410DRAFT_61237 [Rickenella mellea]|uniref:Protein kinase domain-containing protein n=1 Tax=Rickenella mellea TaxID=50990 RepID=A0A4Y7QBG7_9AGAM|nr:hypothetical protein BD410DRAFT_61237 [Rickenella mellea]